MIEASISRDVAIDDSVKHLVYRRSIIQTAETIAAQSQTSRDALLTLNIIEARADLKNAYSVNLTTLAQALADTFKLDTDKVEVANESDESENADAA